MNFPIHELEKLYNEHADVEYAQWSIFERFI